MSLEGESVDFNENYLIDQSLHHLTLKLYC